MQKIRVKTLSDELDLILQKDILRVEITITDSFAESESKSALPKLIRLGRAGRI